MNTTVTEPSRTSLHAQAARRRLEAHLSGAMTLAQAEGMGCEEARRIATLGCDLAARGRLQDALVVFEGLVAGNPRDTSAQAALGAVYQRLDRPRDARACYDRALEACDRNVVALAGRGELRLKSRDLGGLNDLSLAVEVDPRGLTAAGRRARALVAFLLERTNPAAGLRRARR
jgi:tetratricopeptide (TPR) repeat protein